MILDRGGDLGRLDGGYHDWRVGGVYVMGDVFRVFYCGSSGINPVGQ